MWDGVSPHPAPGLPPSLEHVALPLPGTAVLPPDNAAGDFLKHLIHRHGVYPSPAFLFAPSPSAAGAVSAASSRSSITSTSFPSSSVPLPWAGNACKGAYRRLLQFPSGPVTWELLSGGPRVASAPLPPSSFSCRLSFELPAGCFATVALRELTGDDSVLGA